MAQPEAPGPRSPDPQLAAEFVRERNELLKLRESATEEERARIDRTIRKAAAAAGVPDAEAIPADAITETGPDPDEEGSPAGARSARRKGRRTKGAQQPEALAAKLSRLRAELATLQNLNPDEPAQIPTTPGGETVVRAYSRLSAEIRGIERQLDSSAAPERADQAIIEPLLAGSGRGVLVESLINLHGPEPNSYYLGGGLREALVYAESHATSHGTAQPTGVITAEDLLTALVVTSMYRDPTRDRPVGEGRYLDLLLAILLPVWRDLPTFDVRPSSSGVALSPSAVALLAEAARVRIAADQGQKIIGRRHVICAAFLCPEGLGALDARGVFSAGFERIRDGVAAVFDDRTAREGERGGIWQELATRIRAASYHPVRPRERPQLANDGVATKRSADRLGAAQDADALAELICLKATEPPLAIGVFGAWGSGKSSLMSMLHEAVEERVAKTRAAEADGSAKDMPEDAREVSRVVQIRFNAWTYADSDNLWASLTAEFFDQLAAGGHSNWQRSQGQKVVAEIAKRLHVASEDSTAADRVLATEKARRDSAQRAVTELETRRREIDARSVKDYVVGQLGDEKKRKALADGLAAVGGTGATDARSLESSLAELGRFASATTLAAAALKRLPIDRWTLIGVGLFIAVAAGLFAVGMRASPPPSLPAFLSLANLGALLAVLGAVARFAVKRVLPALELFGAFERHRRDEEKRLDAEIAVKRAELASAEQRLRELEQRQAGNANFIAHYGEAAAGRSPAALLQYFLRESADLAAVRSKLGFVATVRRCFETLQDIMREMRDPAVANPVTPDARIDRIVLYIDDLDRCSDTQVVQVLQAIHLLLAFDLFVVVVAVDARWLSHSLRARYKEQLVEDGAAANEGKATVGDYLEKIFQIPFWVRSLQHDGGNAETLLRSIAPTVAPPATAAPASPPPDEKKGEAPSDTSGLVFVDVEEPPATARLEHERAVRLTDAEFALASRLMPLAGRSPRALKRMINIYRLLRVMRRGAALDALVTGDAQNPPEFPAVLFALACQTGAHPAVVARINALLATTTSDTPATWIADALKRERHADKALSDALHGDPQAVSFAQALLVTAASHAEAGSPARKRLEEDASRLVRLDDLAIAVAREFADAGSPMRHLTDRRLRLGFDAVRRFSLSG